MPRYEFRAYVSCDADNEDEARTHIERAVDTLGDVLVSLDESPADEIDEED